MSATTRIVSAATLTGLVVCSAIVPVFAIDTGPKPFEYKSGKIGSKDYGKIGKKNIPFDRSAKYHFGRSPKKLPSATRTKRCR